MCEGSAVLKYTPASSFPEDNFSYWEEGRRVAFMYVLIQGSPYRNRFILKQLELSHVHLFIFSITFVSPAYNHGASFTFKNKHTLTPRPYISKM